MPPRIPISEHNLTKHALRRDTKKRRRHKVSGKSVFALKKIIVQGHTHS